MKGSKLTKNKSVQIVESVRTPEGKIRQRVVLHLGMAGNEEEEKKLRANAEALLPELEAKSKLEKKYAKGQMPLLIPESSEYEKEISPDEYVRSASLVNEEHVTEGPFEVWGHVYNRLGLDNIFGYGARNVGSTNLLKLCLTAKLSEGGSKSSAAAWLGNTLGLKISEDRLYRMMDKLYDRIPDVKERALDIGRNLFGESLSLVLYDVTKLYPLSRTN